MGAGRNSETNELMYPSNQNQEKGGRNGGERKKNYRKAGGREKGYFRATERTVKCGF